MLEAIPQAVRGLSSSSSSSSTTLPMYSPISTCARAPQNNNNNNRRRRPPPTRFLADFTLGFADGLTVPFALTAGLSSLGRTDTVIYAGMAEICAGSISMGIGGYLSARGGDDDGDDDDDDDDDEKKGHTAAAAAAADSYLAPLDLPPELLGAVRAHIDARPDVAGAVAARQADGADDEQEEDALASSSSPVVSGLSVALGYLVGGILPLFPYFLVGQVGDGLLWSFLVCILALFVFGFTKDYMLHRHRQQKTQAWVKAPGLGRERGLRWKDARRSALEGTRMVLLGSIAAVAAVLCVRIFEGMAHQGHRP